VPIAGESRQAPSDASAPEDTAPPCPNAGEGGVMEPMLCTRTHAAARSAAVTGPLRWCANGAGGAVAAGDGAGGWCGMKAAAAAEAAVASDKVGGTASVSGAEPLWLPFTDDKRGAPESEREGDGARPFVAASQTPPDALGPPPGPAAAAGLGPSL